VRRWRDHCTGEDGDLGVSEGEGRTAGVTMIGCRWYFVSGVSRILWSKSSVVYKKGPKGERDATSLLDHR